MPDDEREGWDCWWGWALIYALLFVFAALGQSGLVVEHHIFGS